MKSPSEPGESGPDPRQELRAVVEQVQHRRAAGEPLPDEAVIDSHPHLMPQLERELVRMARIEQARQAAASSVPPGITPAFDAAPTPSFTPSISLPHELGDYVIESWIGKGGMGVVCRAEQRSLRRAVAVKLLRDQLTARDDVVERFRSEALTASQLQHPNIVTIYEFSDYEGRYFISMQLVEGESLAQQVAAKPVPAEEAARLLHAIANAMQYAHEQGVLHRDLKPANILVDRDGTPYITDFGLARHADTAGLTQTGDILGTPEYMSPEQAQGRAADPRSDVYSLGAILYELLTGRPPFRAATPAATIQQVVADSIVLPGRLNSAVPRDLETICLTCLQREPPRRYQTAGELAAELTRFLNHEPILARRPGRIERIARWCRREPKLATAAGIACLLAVTLMVAGPIVAARERGLRRAADAAVTVANEEMSRRRAAQAKTAFQGAQVASRHWQWDDMQSALREALRLEYDDEVGARIQLLDALDGLGDLPGIEREIATLERRQLSAGLAAQVLWRKADLARRRGDHDQKVALAREALAIGIEEPDRSYVASMLSTTTTAQLALLEQAIAVDPLHPRARPQVITLYALSGRLEEARQAARIITLLAPDDPTYRAELALIAVLERDDEAFEANMQRLAAGLAEDEVKLVRDAADVLRGLSEISSSQVNPGGIGTAVMRAVSLLPRLAALQRRFADDAPAGKGSDGPHPLVGLVRSLPPHVLQSYRLAVDAGMAQVSLLSSPSAEQREETIVKLGEAVEAHPDGVIHLFRAAMLSQSQRYAESEAAAVAAAETPSLFATVREDALSFAAMMAGMQFLQGGHRPEDAERMGGLVRRRLAIGSFRNRQIAIVVASVAAFGGDFQLVARLIDTLDERVADDPMLQFRRAEAATQLGQNELAIQLAEQIAQKWPEVENIQRMASEVAVRARASLRKQLDGATGDAPPAGESPAEPDP